MFLQSLARIRIAACRICRTYTNIPMEQSQLASIAKIANVEVRHKEDSPQVVVSFNDLSIDEINRTGNTSIWRVIHWMSVSRWFAFSIPNKKTGQWFMDSNRLLEELVIYQVSNVTLVSQDLYNIVNARVKATPQLDIKVCMGYIGTSSTNIVSSVIDRSTGAVLARGYAHDVWVNKTTRKVMPLPEWWKEKYKNAVLNSERPVVLQETVPTDPGTIIAHYTMKVPWNEMDFYGHTNYLSYVRFCFDAAMDASFNGKYALLSGDILRYKVKDLRVLFKNESRPNDILDVVSWQHPDSPYTLHFSIEKDGSMLCQCHIEFYEPSS